MRLQATLWQQMILWLAKKEESDGNLLVLPDSRRGASRESARTSSEDARQRRRGDLAKYAG